jgi:threonine aldolase
MWEAMQAVPIGMADFGEDTTVAELETRGATLSGHEAALLLPTVTAGTILAVMAGSSPGSVVLMERRAHIYWVEELHVSAICGATPRIVDGDKFGCIPVDTIAGILAESYYGHRQRVTLVCLENTHNICGGTILAPDYISAVSELCHQHAVEVFVDGARLFNAAVALNANLREFTSPVDYAVIALNKGLGAPFGALLCGSEAFIAESRRRARRLGVASLHKAGIYAAAGLVALDTMVERLAEDHERARRLAGELASVPGLGIDLETVQTNLVRVEVSPSLGSAADFAAEMLRRGVRVHSFEEGAFKFAVHYEITDAHIDAAIQITREAAASLEAHGEDVYRGRARSAASSR